ncbi:unnamed protein product [Lota lota]
MLGWVPKARALVIAPTVALQAHSTPGSDYMHRAPEYSHSSISSRRYTLATREPRGGWRVNTPSSSRWLDGISRYQPNAGHREAKHEAVRRARRGPSETITVIKPQMKG